MRILDGLDRPIPFDGTRGGYLLVAANGRHLRLSASAYHLLRQVRSGVDFATLAAALSGSGKRQVEAAEVEASWRRLAARLERLAGDAAAARLPPGFRLRRRLLGPAAVRRLAAPLSVLFTPWLALPAVLLIAVSLGVLVVGDPAASLRSAAFWPGYGLFLLSLLVHELGHAAACLRQGAPPGAIGAALYLIYPALYTDVTAAWRLRRWQRVIVDVGGAYTQLLVGALFVLAYQLTGWLPWAAASWMIAISCLFALNPVFRFDGYWALADALGVTNLEHQPRRLLEAIAARWRGQPWKLPEPGWRGIVLLLYAPLSFAVWAVFIARLVPALIARAVAYPQLLHDLTAAWRQGQALGALLGELLLSTFLLLIAAAMMRRLVLRLLQRRSRGLAPSNATAGASLKRMPLHLRSSSAKPPPKGV